MPITWLAELKDYIQSLKDMNDYQRDECFSYLQLLNTNVGGTEPENMSSNTNIMYARMQTDEDALTEDQFSPRD